MGSTASFWAWLIAHVFLDVGLKSFFDMTKGFLKRNGFLFAAGVGGGLLAKALGFSSDTSLLFAGLCFIIVLQGYQAANTATR